MELPHARRSMSKPRDLSRSRRRSGGATPGLESLEGRLCLSGVDAISLGDVNGDQVVDVAVAGHQGNTYEVTIYSGLGQPDAGLATDTAPLVLATVPDPFPRSSGPLDVALGDFDGDGLSELAISSSRSNEVVVYSFRQDPAAPVQGPLNQPVTPVAMGAPFVPAGLERARGLNVTAAALGGNGVSQLIAAPAARGPGRVVVLSDDSQAGWQAVQTLVGIPVSAHRGLSLSAGDLDGDGTVDIAVGSASNGRVSVYDGALGTWGRPTSPLGRRTRDVRVAIVISEGAGASGSLVVTAGKGGAKAAIVPWMGTPQRFRLAASPGRGALVPLGAGYVFRPSTLTTPPPTPGDPHPFQYSPGPATPSVLFASTRGSQLVIQDFAPIGSAGSAVAQFAPSAPDTYVEPLWGDPGKGFIPLQVQSDPDATGSSKPANPNVPTIDLVVLPRNAYPSPFSIDLSGVPGSVTEGLLTVQPLNAPTASLWGPKAVVNTPPTVDAQTTTQSLQARVIAAYESFLGVDYQHHYNPLWAPTQQDAWNVTGTLAYQSQGIDCTNLTAAAYADALGISFTSDTTRQGEITSNASITFPKAPDGTLDPISKWIDVKTFTPKDWGNTYDGLWKMLQPGDILFIDGKKGGQITHAVTWLGAYGKDTNDQYSGHMVIDATGITPQHVDSNNRIIPEGVHIRPFLYAGGNADAPNGWYFNDIDHVLRIIKTT